MTDKEIKQVVSRLMGKDVLSYRLRDDGFLVVINSQGWKVTFSPSEVQKARANGKRKPKVTDD